MKPERNSIWTEDETEAPRYRIVPGTGEEISIRIIAQRYDPRKQDYKTLRKSAVRFRFDDEAEMERFVRSLRERLAPEV